MMTHAVRPPKPAPFQSLSAASMNLWSPSTLSFILMRSVIHVIAALVVSMAMPAAAQLSGGGGSAVLMQLNVESAEVEGTFLRNGRPFSADFLDSGFIYIESKEGDLIFLGSSINGTYGPLRLMRGRYAPQFSSFFEPATAPRGSRVPFAEPVLVEADQTLDLNVPAVRVTLSFLLNGSTFPNSPGQVADFLLRDSATGREVNIGTSDQGGNEIFVIPGFYDVIYEHQTGSLIPANTRTVILEKVLIDQAMSLDVDVPSVLRTVIYRLNGVPFPVSGLDFGQIHLEDVSTNTSFFVGNTNATALLRVIPGTYRVIYDFRESQGLSPTNRWTIVDEGLEIAVGGNSGIQVEIATHTVDPVFLMDGFAFPGGGLAFAQIEYRADNGTFVSLGRTHEVATPRLLIEGSYDFYYRLWESDDAIPANRLTRFAAGQVVDQSGPLLLNVETAVLDLNVLLDGETFPPTGLDFGRIHLVESESGDEIYLGDSNEGPFLRRIIKGEYDVVYEYRESQGLAPTNAWHVIGRRLQLDGPSSTLVNVRTQLIAPRFSLDGVDFPDTESDYGRFLLRDEDGDEVWLGRTFEGASDRRVIEGTYQVDYEWQSGGDVPLNPREAIETVVVPEPGFAAGVLASMLWGSGLSMRLRRSL